MAFKFIIDGKYVTGSRYKINNTIQYSPIVPRCAITYVESICSRWCPSRAFVIDLALTHKGYKVIEINNINSSGLYDSNIKQLILSIEKMF